ncbi:MAG: hypothetical protein IPO31_00225 [Candidatus Obscuribacter sp.]|nr:hypothetical protein [Candidatus Obscuribacter sp.]
MVNALVKAIFGTVILVMGLALPAIALEESGWVEDDNVDHVYIDKEKWERSKTAPSASYATPSRGDEAYRTPPPLKSPVSRPTTRAVEDEDEDGIVFDSSTSQAQSKQSKMSALKDPDDDLSDSSYRLGSPAQPNFSTPDNRQGAYRERFTAPIPAANASNTESFAAGSVSGTDSPAKDGKKNWFLNPPEVPWINSLGRGIKNTGKGTLNAVAAVGETGANVLSSPEFWGLVGAGAAAYGTYKFAQRNPYYYGSGMPYYPGITPYAMPYGGYNPNLNWVNPYTNSNGRFVPGYFRTAPNGVLYDNLGY